MLKDRDDGETKLLLLQQPNDLYRFAPEIMIVYSTHTICYHFLQKLNTGCLVTISVHTLLADDQQGASLLHSLKNKFNEICLFNVTRTKQNKSEHVRDNLFYIKLNFGSESVTQCLHFQSMP